MHQKHLLSISAFLLAAVTHIATSESTPQGFKDDIQDHNLEGLINEVDWVFGSGVAIYDADDDEYLVRLYAEQVDDPCTLQSSVNKILFTMPNQVGPYALEFGQHTVTLVEDRESESPMNYIAISGTVEVYQIESQLISAGMAVYVDDQSWVNGQFELTVCD